MFERFTDRARRVLVLAQEEARLLNHGYIGTEHILLALIHEGDGVAAKVLESLDISLDAVRAEVEATVGPSLDSPVGSPLFTPRAKKVLELSLREVLQVGHNYIGTEHMLLGLLREGESVAVQVLVSVGADLTKVRQAVMEQIAVMPPTEGIGMTREARPALPVRVGTEWSAALVCTGRAPADFANAQRKVIDLAAKLGVVVDEAEIGVSSVETEQGPGLRLTLSLRFDEPTSEDEARDGRRWRVVGVAVPLD